MRLLNLRDGRRRRLLNRLVTLWSRFRSVPLANTSLALFSLLLSTAAIGSAVQHIPVLTSTIGSSGSAECRGPLSTATPYMDAIQRSIERCFVFPPSLTDGAKCTVRVWQTQEGIVTAVKTGECVGHPKFRDFAERAVLKASPLPIPSNALSYVPVFDIVFSPDVDLFRQSLRANAPAIQEINIGPSFNALPRSSSNQEPNGPAFLRTEFVSAIKPGRHKAYVDACLAKIVEAGNRHYPDDARGKFYGTLFVSFIVSSSGKLERISISKGSGSKILDEALSIAIKNAAPFDPFPPDMAQQLDALSITVSFTYSNGNDSVLSGTGPDVAGKAAVASAPAAVMRPPNDALSTRPPSYTSCDGHAKGLTPSSPVYPRESRLLKEEGQVMLTVYVDQRGKPVDINVRKTSGFDRLDLAAVEAVSKWCFYPATKDGEPVAARVVVPVTFSLED